MKEEYLKLNDGSRMPPLGMGTWYLGENKAARKQEIEALRAGIHIKRTYFFQKNVCKIFIA